MAGFRIEGNTSGNVAEVTPENALIVALGNDSLDNGILAITGRSDAGDFTGTPLDIDPEVDADYRMRVAQDRLDFQETFSGAALNSAQWSSTVTTMATAVSGSCLSLNSANSVATSAVARVQSYRSFVLTPGGALELDIPIKVVAASVGIANTTWELGFFLASGITAPTDGVFLRMNAAGDLQLVASFGGAETQSAPIAFTTTPTGWDSAVLPENVDREVLLVVTASTVYLWIDDTLITTLEQPAAQPAFMQAQSLPVTFRVYNSAGIAPATATQIRVGPMAVTTCGLTNTLSVAETATLMGAGGYQGQSGGTMGSTANWANSAAPAAATLSNTAAGYTTFGGQYLFNAPAGAETDYALFGFQVPALAANANNKNLLIYGVRIDAINIGADVATTATVLQWAIGVGSTAVSLATAEAATTRARRVVPLGMQGFIVGAAIGAAGATVQKVFRGGLLAEPGSFVHIIMKVPVGTATASQRIRGTVSIDADYV